MRAVAGLEDADAVGAQGLGDRLEEGRAAGGAVAAAAGGQTVGDAVAAVQRAAGVAGLGADRGLDHAVDDVTAAVVDGRVERGDPPAVDAGGGAAAVDRGAHARGGGAGDVDAADGAGDRRGRVAGRVLDEAVVVGREAGPGRRTERGRVPGVRPPGARAVGAVTGGQEVVGAAAADVEAEGAAPATRIDGVATGDQLVELAGGPLDRER